MEVKCKSKKIDKKKRKSYRVSQEKLDKEFLLYSSTIYTMRTICICYEFLILFVLTYFISFHIM